MKKISIVTPKMSGLRGTETVITDVMNQFDEIRLIVVGVNEHSEWLRKYDKENRLSYFASNNKIFRLLYLINFLMKTNDEELIFINTRMINIANIIRKIFKKKYKIISWMHFSLYHTSTITTKYLKKADMHLAISSGIKEQMIEQGITEDKIELIYNPIKREQFNVLKNSSGILELIYIGSIEVNHQKNMEELFNALSILSVKWKLNIYGTGVDESECKKLSKSLNIDDKIIWNGWKSDPWDNIKTCDALVLPTNFEGLPMVLLEAMSRGIPCIANDCPTGPKDIIKEDINGYLVRLNDSSDFSQKIEKLNGSEFDRPEIKESIKPFYKNEYFKKLSKVI